MCITSVTATAESVRPSHLAQLSKGALLHRPLP
jgi:hypothetical protein